jgi:hypothetical protein
MPKLVYLSALALLLLAGTFLLTDRLVRPPGVTEANTKLIKPGMTARWVQHLLGPHGQIGDDNLFLDPNTVSVGYRWFGADGNVMVWFGPSGLVTSAQWEPHPVKPGGGN